MKMLRNNCIWKTIVFKARRVLVALALVLLSAGCQYKSGDSSESLRVKSTTGAPFELKVSGEWRSEAPSSINSRADIVLTRRQPRIYLMVISQKVSSIDGIPGPSVETVKRTALEDLRGKLETLKVEKQGSISIGGEPGITVFARATVDSVPVQYILNYVTHGPWQFQIVVWSKQMGQTELARIANRAVDGWMFLDESDKQTNSQSKESNK